MTILIDVCNLALDLLGERNIQSLDGTNHLEKLMNRWAIHTYNDLIRQYRPNFTTTTSKLTYNVIEQGFSLPTDYVIIVSASIPKYRIQDQIIIVYDSNDNIIQTTDPIEIEYVSNKIEKISFASSSFTNAFAHSLAARLAFPITKEPTVANAINSLAKEALRSYAYSDNQERRPSRFAQGLQEMSTWDRR